MALKQELESQGVWLFRHRSYLPLVILFTGLWVFIDTNLYDHKSENFKFIFQLVCFSISLFGLAVRVYTVGHTPKNTSGRNTTEGQVAETLNTTGIYSVVRHPLYVGNFFMWLGIAVLTENTWFVGCFILAYWLYYERIMFAEEQFLERKFGDVYRIWSARVPAFIPRLSFFIPSVEKFSFKKVVKNEKTGVLLMFLVFAMFDFIGEWLNNHDHYTEWLFIGLLIAALWYVTIKLISKRTRLLNERSEY